MPKLVSLDSILEDASHGTGIKGPKVLYHYTSWEAAESIISQQRFRATAHDCTNDPRELVTADDTILSVVREALATVPSVVADRVLNQFLSIYPTSRIGASRRTYLACFSQGRDDPHQWMRYGRQGQGVCLGIRLLGAESPVLPGVSIGILPVTYGVDELRTSHASYLSQFVAICRNAVDVDHNRQLAIDTLSTIAASWALATKDEEWRPEQEVRMIFLPRGNSHLETTEKSRPDGSVRRYVTVPVTSRTRMPIHEFLLGPAQDLETGRERATSILKMARYKFPERKVHFSTAARI